MPHDALTHEPDEDYPGLPISSLTADQVDEAVDELLALVDARLPERFYRGEGRWRPLAAALIARMADTLDSIRVLGPTGRQSDALILLRALYEQTVTFCWVAIDPDRHLERWFNESWIQRLKMHNETAAAFDIPLMSEAEAARAKALKDEHRGMPQITQRADEIDGYWSPRIAGFREPAHMLALRGLYTTIYRKASQTAHAQVESIDDCLDLRQHPYIAHRESSDSLLYQAFGVPFLCMALLVCADRFGWPEDSAVRSINDSLLRAEREQRGAGTDDGA